MKIIFLDIDGVLNSRRYDARRDWTTLSNIDETRLPLVKKIVDKTGARIVLSSTWRDGWEKKEALCSEDGMYINRTFAKYGLRIYDKTPDLDLHASRPDEIAAYLSNAEGVDAFVIIDDYRYAWGALGDYFVKTNPHFGLGLEEEHAERAIEILNR